MKKKILRKKLENERKQLERKKKIKENKEGK